MSISSLSSLSEEEQLIPRPRTFRNRNNPFEMYDDNDFNTRFRFSKPVIMELLHIFGNHIQPMTKRNMSISSMNQLLITLRYYATGAYQQILGDSMNIHKSTVCRIVHRVTRVVARMKNQYINMPNGVEINQVALDFYGIRGFPRVIGAIDCTHIKIASPGGLNAESYRNRKGYFSINVQAICDANLKIRHIIARWPGSVHDSTIFNDSPLPALFENGTFGNKYLLGDSGYPCKQFLLTPLLNPRNDSETEYNRAHISTRNTVERCFGLLKRRFPCLYLGMPLKLDNVLPVIVACSVLHNIGINLHDNEPPDEFPYDDFIEDEELDAAAERNESTAVRTALINTVFRR